MKTKKEMLECQCGYYQGATCKVCKPKLSLLPWKIKSEFNIMSGSRTVATTGGHSSSLRSEQVYEENVNNATLIVRRVNQGPAFDALVEAVQAILKWDTKNMSIAQNTEGCEVLGKLYAALKLAQEVC